MELICLLLSFLFANEFMQVSALKIPIKRAGVVKRALGASVKSVSLGGAGNNNALGTVGDIRYTTTIKVNGVDILVALDTGSTDLWVIPPGGVGQYNDTGIPLSLRYGDGTYGVDGTIGLAPFEFGPYKIDRQAFLNANSSTISQMTDINIYGLMGLGFDSPLLSPINDKITTLYGSEQSWAASVLANIFLQIPSAPNIIALELQRTGDLEDTDGGTFTIGEVELEFVAVQNSPQLHQYPPGNGRWTTLLDGMRVDGKDVSITSSMKDVPSGKSVTLLDTGNPSLQITKEMRDAIFSGISGAVIDPSGTWIVPCEITTIVEFLFSGQWYAVHPLDLTNVHSVTDNGGKNWTVCMGDNVIVGPGDGFDIVLGTPYLRNVYSVYNFGNPFASDSKGPTPYMQFLSTTNAQTAMADAVASRKATLSQMGPEVSPQDYVNALKSNSGTSGSTLDVTTTKSDSESTVEKYAPAVIGLLAANLLVGLVLIVLAVLGCVRRGSRGAPSSSAPSYVPVKLKDEDHTDTSYHMPYATR